MARAPDPASFCIENYKTILDIWCTIYYNIYIGGDKQVSKQKKKPDIDLKSWLLGAITDLIIGIILLILDKLLN